MGLGTSKTSKKQNKNKCLIRLVLRIYELGENKKGMLMRVPF
jgi:hypothetical protein